MLYLNVSYYFGFKIIDVRYYMTEFKFNKELYSKIALIKAAYNFTDIAYVHLDCDDKYYYVDIQSKNSEAISLEDFANEMLTQSVRHEVYLQTKNIMKMRY